MRNILKPLILTLIILTPLSKAFSIVGEDDRFYVYNTKWSDLFSGIVKISHYSQVSHSNQPPGCSGFLLEGDVIVTAAHCLSSEPNSIINEDRSINLKKLKKIKVNFGDAHYISGQKLLDKRSKNYSIKEVFLGANWNDCSQGAAMEDLFKDDFAFIKLNEEIPKKYKRFKMLKDINLNEYKILDHKFQKGLSVSTVGYHGDNSKTLWQRLAHVGCRMREARKYKNVWFLYTDCDAIYGASGSPFFKILKHKETKAIELGVLSLLIRGRSIGKNREIKYQTELYIDEHPKYHLSRKKTYRKFKEFEETLSGNPQYNLKSKTGTFSEALSLNNHLLFTKTLARFRNDSSQWNNKTLPPTTTYDVLKKEFVVKKVESLTKMSDVRDYLDFLNKNNFFKLEGCEGSVEKPLFVYFKYYLEIYLTDMYDKKKDVLTDKEKQDFEYIQNTYLTLFNKWIKPPTSNQRKSLSYKNIMTAYGISFLKENGIFKHQSAVNFPLTDAKKNKKHSDRLWDSYFNK